MVQDRKGKVYLVGAGPGDPGLLTIKGRDCLSLAQVVIYDNLANRAFLQYAPDQAELIYVGKKGGCHTKSQDEINSLVIDRAHRGHIVVRLKGGDPFVFGRGGEEAQELVKAGVDFEVVPGVTSAIAVPAYAGVPLTHRDYTSTVAFVTGHEDPNKEASDIEWNKLATGVGTLVFLMGVGNVSTIVEKLIANGRSPDTPAALIQNGTVAAQRTLVGPLRDIAGLAKKNHVKPPGIIVVGDVVRLREKLNWFETRPLFGKRIMVTRARDQASEFLKGLTHLGAECIEFPTIEVVPPENWDALDRAIGALETYQWVVFTSVNGVKYFLRRLAALGRDIRDLKGLHIGAIGPKTAQRWHRLGIEPDLVPEEYRAEAVVECFRKKGAKGARVLIPRAAKAREVLPEELRKMGARVDVVPAYRTIKPSQDTARVSELLEKGAIDMVTFTSSSTVTNFLGMFEAHRDRTPGWMRHVVVACIGPITARTAQENGLSVDLVPTEYTVEALTDSIVRYFMSH